MNTILSSGYLDRAVDGGAARSHRRGGCRCGGDVRVVPPRAGADRRPRRGSRRRAVRRVEIPLRRNALERGVAGARRRAGGGRRDRLARTSQSRDTDAGRGACSLPMFRPTWCANWRIRAGSRRRCPEFDCDVTVVFCDIRNFTALSATLQPARVRDLLDRYYEYSVAIIHRHRGTVMQFVGDEVFAVFGAPVAGRQRLPARRLRCAVGDAGRGRLARRPADGRRAAAASGSASGSTVDRSWPPTSVRRTAVSTPSLAKPSTSAPGCASGPAPGQIVVSDQAWNTVAPELRHHFVAEGSIDLKGVVAPVAVYRASRASPVPGGHDSATAGAASNGDGRGEPFDARHGGPIGSVGTRARRGGRKIRRERRMSRWRVVTIGVRAGACGRRHVSLIAAICSVALWWGGACPGARVARAGTGGGRRCVGDRSPGSSCAAAPMPRTCCWLRSSRLPWVTACAPTTPDMRRSPTSTGRARASTSTPSSRSSSWSTTRESPRRGRRWGSDARGTGSSRWARGEFTVETSQATATVRGTAFAIDCPTAVTVLVPRRQRHHRVDPWPMVRWSWSSAPAEVVVDRRGRRTDHPGGVRPGSRRSVAGRQRQPGHRGRVRRPGDDPAGQRSDHDRSRRHGTPTPSTESTTTTEPQTSTTTTEPSETEPSTTTSTEPPTTSTDVRRRTSTDRRRRRPRSTEPPTTSTEPTDDVGNDDHIDVHDDDVDDDIDIDDDLARTTANATVRPEQIALCHRVEGLGNTGNGYNLLVVDDADSARSTRVHPRRPRPGAEPPSATSCPKWRPSSTVGFAAALDHHDDDTRPGDHAAAPVIEGGDSRAGTRPAVTPTADHGGGTSAGRRRWRCSRTPPPWSRRSRRASTESPADWPPRQSPRRAPSGSGTGRVVRPTSAGDPHGSRVTGWASDPRSRSLNDTAHAARIVQRARLAQGGHIVNLEASPPHPDHASLDELLEDPIGRRSGSSRHRRQVVLAQADHDR